MRNMKNVFSVGRAGMRFSQLRYARQFKSIVVEQPQLVASALLQELNSTLRRVDMTKQNYVQEHAGVESELRKMLNIGKLLLQDHDVDQAKQIMETLIKAITSENQYTSNKQLASDIYFSYAKALQRGDQQDCLFAEMQYEQVIALDANHVAEAKKQLTALRHGRFVFDDNERFRFIDDEVDEGDAFSHANTLTK